MRGAESGHRFSSEKTPGDRSFESRVEFEENPRLPAILLCYT